MDVVDERKCVVPNVIEQQRHSAVSLLWTMERKRRLHSIYDRPSFIHKRRELVPLLLSRTRTAHLLFLSNEGDATLAQKEQDLYAKVSRDDNNAAATIFVRKKRKKCMINAVRFSFYKCTLQTAT